MTDYKYLVNEDLRDGPVVARKCTDMAFCFVFLAFWIGVVGISIVAFYQGNPGLVLYPYDSSGNQCGRPSHSTKEYKYLYYPAAGVINTNFSDYRICLKSCPKSNGTHVECYENSHVSCDDIHPTFYIKHLNLNIDSYETDELLERFCIPESKLYFFNDVIDKVFKTGITTWISDVLRCWKIIAIVLSISLGVSFIYLILLRFCAELIVWSSILLSATMIIVFGVYINLIANENYSDESEKKTYKALHIASTLIFCSVIIFALVIIFLYRRIHLATAIMKSGAIFINDTPLVVLLPILVYLISCIYFIFWILSLIYIYSSGHLDKTTSGIAQISWDNTTRNSFYFQLLSVLWVNSFKIALSQFMVSCTVCFWYFSRDSSSFQMISNSIYFAFRFHLGTLAFGSLILSLIKPVKFAFWYLKEKVYKPAYEGNKFVMFCCVSLACCVKFFERFVEFIDKHAYVQTALAGTGFCEGAKNAFALICENASSFLVLGAVGDIFKVLGKIFIMIVSTYSGFLIISYNEPYRSSVQSPIPPTIVFGIVSYIVAGIFMTVHEMACDTIIQVYLVDEQIHKTAFFAPEPLKEFIDNYRDSDHKLYCCGCL